MGDNPENRIEEEGAIQSRSPGAGRPRDEGRERDPSRPGGGGGQGPQGLRADAEPWPEEGGGVAGADPAGRSEAKPSRGGLRGSREGSSGSPGRPRAAGLTALAAAAAPDDAGPDASCLLRRDLRLFMAKSWQSLSR